MYTALNAVRVIRVLLIEDDLADKILLEALFAQIMREFPLRWTYKIDHATTLAAGLDRFLAHSYQVVITDLNLPDSQGMETLKRITRAMVNVPIVLLTGYADEAFALSAIQHGAQDYLTKGEFSHTFLMRTLHYAIERHRMEQRQAVLAEAQFAIQEPSELRALLTQIVQTVTDLLPASAGASIVLWNAEEERFITSASTVRNQTSDTTAQRVRKEGGASRWIVDNRRPLIVPDTSQDPFGANPMVDEFAIHSYVGVPVSNEDRCIGVLYALDYHLRDYTPNDLSFLMTLSNWAGLAVSRVELYDQLRAQTVDLTARTKIWQPFPIPWPMILKIC